jgi:formylglycine-generating enzyme required for sulfatase activity
MAGALAGYDAGNPTWTEVAKKVAAAMSRAPLGDWTGWREALRDVRTPLTDPLAQILRDPERQDIRPFVASLLADYAVDRPDLLVDLLLDADLNSFAPLFQAVQNQGPNCIDHLREAVARALPGPAFEARARKDAAAGQSSNSREEIERAKDRLASRGAQAAVALLRLGRTGEVWRLLEYSPDPHSRCAFIGALSTSRVDPALLVAELGRLDEERSQAGPTGERNAYLFDPATARRRALILALAGTSKDALGPRERDALVSTLIALHRDDPDAGIHSASELVLERWGYSDRSRPPLLGGNPADRRWYVNPEGQTMVLVDGPVEFQMGSPDSDPDHQKEETYHRRRIPHAYFIASREVTIGEFQRFSIATRGAPYEYNERYSQAPHGPIIGLNWYEAAAYCNWLSDRDTLPRCYELNEKKEYGEGMRVSAAAVARGGYRLPTEAEWEYACRAGTATSRYMGTRLPFMGRYEWYVENSGFRTHPCGGLLPNDFGLFDMLGNVMEWCHDPYSEGRFRHNQMAVVSDCIVDERVPSGPRYHRGGAFRSDPIANRSANCGWFDAWGRRSDIGFRPARTLP